MEHFAPAVWPEQPVASPGKPRGPVRPASRATAGAPHEITGAPPTPLPATRRRSRAPVVIGLVVVAAGVAAYLMLGREGTAPGSPLPAPSIDTVRIQDTVRVPVARRSARAKQAPPAQAQAQGFLTIAADPLGQVYID